MSSDQTENIALRNYISYMQRRIKFLNTDIVLSYKNERYFYIALKNKIKDWGKNHLIYYKHLIGLIDFKTAVNHYGMSERTVYRMFRSQRKELLVFIGVWEKELERLYPF